MPNYNECNMKIIILIISILSIFLTACEQSDDDPGAQVFVLPTEAQLPTVTPITPTITENVALATPLILPSATITNTTVPTLNIATPTAVGTTQSMTSTPILLPTATLPRQPITLPPIFSFGQSSRGTELLAYTFGSGDTVLMLIGGIHGGFEANTIELVERMIDHFTTTPQAVLSNMVLILIPSINPDGASVGSNLQARFNARGVDLNRNWGCDWQPEAVFQQRPVNAGTQAFSEPETLALASLINDIQPNTVLFYHSAANGVFSGDCNDSSISTEMVAVLGEATGYPYESSFNAYPLTGTASNWVDSLGIPSAAVELATNASPEFNRNMNGVMALQCWLLGARSAGISQCE